MYAIHAETHRQREQLQRRERMLCQRFKDALVSIGVTPGQLGQDGMTFYPRLNNDAWFRLARAIETRTIPFRFRDERYADRYIPEWTERRKNGDVGNIHGALVIVPHKDLVRSIKEEQS